MGALRHAIKNKSPEEGTKTAVEENEYDDDDGD